MHSIYNFTLSWYSWILVNTFGIALCDNKNNNLISTVLLPKNDDIITEEYEKNDPVLPALCFLVKDFGFCNDPSENVTRWAFHAHIQECIEFTYSGCGGNQNNFLTELACYDRCTKPVSGGCELDTDIATSDLAPGFIKRRCGIPVQQTR